MSKIDKSKEFELDTLYMAALLVLHGRKKGGERKGDSVLERTLSELGIDRGAFARYLETHEEDLQHTLQCIGI